MKLLLFVFCSLLTLNSFAGASNVDVTCTSDSGRTKVTATVPGDNPEALISLTVDKQTVTYLNQELIDLYAMNSFLGKVPDGLLSEIITIDDLELGAFAIVVNDSDFRLVADSKTIKVTNKDYSVRAVFKARLHGNDPRDQKSGYLRDISLNCSYLYSL